MFPCSTTLGLYRDYQWPLVRENNGKVLDIRGDVQGELKNGAQIVSDPDLGDVVSLEASEAWILMGDFKGIFFTSFLLKRNSNQKTDVSGHGPLSAMLVKTIAFFPQGPRSLAFRRFKTILRGFQMRKQRF